MSEDKRDQIRLMRDLAGRLLAAADQGDAGFPELMEKMRKVATELLEEARSFENSRQRTRSG